MMINYNPNYDHGVQLVIHPSMFLTTPVPSLSYVSLPVALPTEETSESYITVYNVKDKDSSEYLL